MREGVEENEWKKKKPEKKLQIFGRNKDAPPVLPPLDEAPVEVDADRPLVEHGPAEVLHGVLGVRAGVEDNCVF